ncbi:dihydropteroate synthase [Paraglaciecola sp.]|uniref:dihydropteroate synthase n=1 Tax=Paraglaciecola sp. TaxID=1920173 RepID=UPI00273F0657|nr:dihydropteroate synthase [Paraglaciecola sp.]MDP5030272.1 dihydropteroate synthase [Paraglaciecola sp.]
MQFNDKFVDLSSPKVMGILNVTPDSFSDGGAFVLADEAIRQAQRMIESGASFIDVGGESTRPGAKPVSVQEELDRVVPIIEALKQRFDTVVSVDTSKAEVMKAAVKAGAGLINDVRALQEDEALKAAAHAQIPVCLMHMQGQPRSMQMSPNYQNVVSDVTDFLQKRISQCIEAGIAHQDILIDPGFGFGKTLAHNYQLLANLAKLKHLGAGMLIGLSRKTMIGEVINRPVHERLAGSISGALLAVQQGAQIIRVHDVRETVDAIKILTTMNTYKDNRDER